MQKGRQQERRYHPLPVLIKQWSRRGSSSKTCVGTLSKYKKSLFKIHKLCYGSIVIVLSTWHSLQSSGTGVSAEPRLFLIVFIDVEHPPGMWAVPLYGVGLGLFKKERKRWARVVFREIMRRLWRASETRLYVGGLESSQGPVEQNCMKLWRKTAFQLKRELQRIGDPRPCDIDNHSYRWKAELGKDWEREKLCVPGSEMDGWGSQNLWSLLDCTTSLRLQT